MFPIQQLLRMKLEADSGAPGGGGSGAGAGSAGPSGGSASPITDPPANPTPGTGGQAGPAGPGTGAPTPGQNGGTGINPQQPTNPAQPPVAKFTDADMKSAREKWEADGKKKADDAAEAARIKEAEDQGNFKKAHEELKPKYDAATRQVDRYRPLLETWLTESVSEWPEKMKAKIDGETDFDRKLDLFEDLRDIAADFAQVQGGNQKPPMTSLNHIPGAAGGSGSGAGANLTNPAKAMLAKRYLGPPQPKSN